MCEDFSNNEIIEIIEINTENTRHKVVFNKQTNLNTETIAKKEPKKRVDSTHWTFSDEYFEYEKQIQLVEDIYNNGFRYVEGDMVSKIVSQQINKKIAGYKQQDVFKKRLNTEKFLDFESVIRQMRECVLKCRYCKIEMFVLYDISREMKQWSVDRIDNNLGHNIDNFYLSCLECNLQKRRRADDKYLFTKQLTIVKTGI
jgi:hypothetical protein